MATPAGPPPATGKMHTVYRDHDIAVESDDITTNIETGEFSTPHTLKVSRPGSDAVGDSGHGNYHDGTATLVGHVVVHDSGNAPEAHAAGAKTGQGPSTLMCDQLSVDSKRKIYIATGNVHYVQGDASATSQNARLDLGAHTLDLEGDVHLTQGDNTMSAQTVHYDTLTKDVHSTGVPVLINGPAQAGPQPSPSAKATPTPTPRH
jgi:lipopolysaccharide export system protein LptA